MSLKNSQKFIISETDALPGDRRHPQENQVVSGKDFNETESMEYFQRAMSGGENAVAKILLEEHFTQHRLYPNYFLKGSNGSNGNEWSTTGLSGFKKGNSGHILLDPRMSRLFSVMDRFPDPHIR